VNIASTLRNRFNVEKTLQKRLMLNCNVCKTSAIQHSETMIQH